MADYTVEKGMILCEDGIPLLPRYLVDERVACEIDETGIRSIDYFNAATSGSFRIVYPEFWGGIRFYLREGNELYSQSLKHTRLLPFGFEGIWEAAGHSFEYCQAVLGDCILIRLTVPDGQCEAGVAFRLQAEFYEASFLTPQPAGDVRYKNGVKRTWDSWKEDGGCLIGGFTEEDGGTFGLCIGSNQELSIQRSERNYKYRLTGKTLQPGQSCILIFAFDTNQANARARFTGMLGGWQEAYAGQQARYARVAERAPVLVSPYPALNRFFSLAPMYHESLKIQSYPGAIRAKSTYYWVWGWDGMTSNDAAAYWGDTEFLRDMLAFYRDYANEDGIAHAFSRDMKGTDPAPLPAQGMYLTLLYLYYSNGGTIDEFYPFAASIFDRMCEAEAGDTGFGTGTSLFPDHRALLGETGDDISGFNNTVFYCAARSMEVLAGVMGEAEESARAGEIAGRMEKNFMKLFYDEDVKYIACSVDSKTFQKRNVYNANSMKWENSFLKDLADPMNEDALTFFCRHIVTDCGLREIPAWCRAYDLDANQLHCWWPVTGEYFARLINQFNHRELIEKWISWVSYWTDLLLCPEGISCYVNTKTPALDNWNCQNGTWHAYSMRGWYQAAVHAVVGADADAGGLTFYPYEGEEMELYGFHYKDRQYIIRMKGSGSYISRITAGTFEVEGTNKLPADLLSAAESDADLSGEFPEITVYRTGSNPYPVSIVDGIGIRLTDYSLAENGLSVRLSGYGHARLRLRIRREAAGKLTVRLDGSVVSLQYLYDGLAVVPVDFGTGSQKELTVSWEEEPEQIIWHKEPAGSWPEGMPLGNGRIGLMVPGGVTRERIGLNEDTLWAGYPVQSTREGMAEYYNQAVKLVAEGKRKEAQVLLEQNFGDSLVQPYLPLGDLILSMDHEEEYRNYRRILYLNAAECEIGYQAGNVCYRRNLYVSRPDQGAVISLTCDVPGKLSFSAGLECRLRHTCTSDGKGELILDGICPVCRAPYGEKYTDQSLIYSEHPQEQGVSFRCILRVVAADGTLEEQNGKIVVKHATKAVLYLTVRTSFAGPDRHPALHGAEYKNACAADMKRLSEKKEEDVRMAHIFDYRSLYGLTSFSLTGSGMALQPLRERLKRHGEQRDKGLYELLFHFGRYLLISCSRKGTRAANLQGIWNDKLLAPWSSNYTLNINTEMNYWPALRLGLFECMEPLISFTQALAKNGRDTAARYYGAKGSASHHASDVWCTSWPSTNLIADCGKWGLWPMSGGWLARSMYEWYEYTNDIDALNETVLPVLKGCAEFYESLLIQKDGKWILGPSTSPENSFYDGGERVSLSDTSAMTMSIVKDVFTLYLRALDALSMNSPLADRIRILLPDLTGLTVGSDGRILEWDKEYPESEPGHRHMSHLYGLYPGEEINPWRKEDESLAKACRETLIKRGDEGTGWSLAWKLNLWARLKDGRQALKMLDMQLRPVFDSGQQMRGGGSYISLLCAHPPFQIDGNFGVCSGILEMLIGQYGNEIHLLPALPPEWSSGRLTGIALKGDAVLNLAWEDGHVTQADIVPEEKRTDYRIYEKGVRYL